MTIGSAFTGLDQNDYLFQFGDDGQVLNTDVTPDEPFVDITRVVGLSNAPFREYEHSYYGADGGFVHAEHEQIRPIVLEGNIYSNNVSLLEPFLDRLKAEYGPSSATKPLYIVAPGISPRILFCKSYGITYDWDTRRRVGEIPFQIVLRAEDPSFYGEQESHSVDLIDVDAVQLGRGYNKSFDYSYGGAGQTAPTLVLVVGGNRPTNGVFRIHGPVLDPSIINNETGQTMKFLIAIGPEDFLEVNLRNRTVKLNGMANRRNTLRGSNPWFLLQPGVNTFRFVGTQHVVGPPNPRLEGIFRPAYR